MGLKEVGRGAYWKLFLPCWYRHCNYTCKIDYNFVGNMILLQFCLKIVGKFMKDKTPHIYSLHPLHEYRSFSFISFENQAVFLALNYLLLSKELRKNFTGHLKCFAHTSSDTWNKIRAYLPNKLGDIYERLKVRTKRFCYLAQRQEKTVNCLGPGLEPSGYSREHTVFCLQTVNLDRRVVQKDSHS